jgi:hypothetical protein
MDSVTRYDTGDGVILSHYGLKIKPAVDRELWTDDEVRDLAYALTEVALIHRETSLTNQELVWELERRWQHIPDDRMYRFVVAARIITDEVRHGRVK